MFRYLKKLSFHRSIWFAFLLSACILEGIALYFQHAMGLKPCVMCIYQRLALLAILFAGFIGFLTPKWGFFRWSALGLALYGSIKGLHLAITHTNYQLNPAPWNQCSPFVEFPQTLPLNQWFPSIFEATGDCSKIDWQFLGLSMSQWLIVIFSIYLLITTLLILSQFSRGYHKERSLFH